MSEYDQHEFGFSTFIENPDPRCPVVLLLDTSGSMHGHPIAELNQGLQDFKKDIINDHLAVKRIEIAIITFGPVKIIQNFVTPDDFLPPELTAEGSTPMGSAIEKAVQLLEERKSIYKNNGIAYYRPWIFLITDGSPTDSIEHAIHLIHRGENEKKFVFYSVGINDADFKTLKTLSNSVDPLKLKGLNFSELFQWISASLSKVSHSIPGDKVTLSNPVTAKGWGEIP